jgi:hypothetical protein
VENSKYIIKTRCYDPILRVESRKFYISSEVEALVAQRKEHAGSEEEKTPRTSCPMVAFERVGSRDIS